YKKENLLQIFVTNTPKKPKDIYSFLAPTIRDILTLEDNGMNVYDINGERIKVKAYVGTVVGDIPAISELIFHTGHISYNGCRICKIVGQKREITQMMGTSRRTLKTGGIYFPIENLAELEPEKRTKQEFEPESNFSEFAEREVGNRNSLKKGTPISLFKMFDGQELFGMEELHLWGHNIARQLWKLFENENGKYGVKNPYQMQKKYRDELGKRMSELRAEVPFDMFDGTF
ncbi:hypothetical protein INT48_006916, partial [Thamnidium elegans]